MKLFIPDIGTSLTLAEDWTFNLHYESRNQNLVDLMDLCSTDKFVETMTKYTARTGRTDPYWFQYDNDDFVWSITLPKGTNLTVDRVYIRKGAADFSSLTFNIRKTDHPLLNTTKRKRFWAKLADVNQMEIV